MRLSVKVKLLGGFLLVAILAAIIGGVGSYQIRKVDDNGTLLYEKVTVPISQLSAMTGNFNRIRGNILLAIVETDPAKRAAFLERIPTQEAEIEKNAAEYEKLLFSPEGKQLFNDWRALDKQFEEVKDKCIAEIKGGRTAEATALLMGSSELMQKINKAIDAMIVSKIGHARKTDETNTAIAGKAISMMIGLSVAAFILAVGIGIWISLGILRALAAVKSTTERAAQGDLTARVKVSSHDEFGDMAGDLNGFLDQLETLIGQLKAGFQTIRTGIETIRGGAKEVAQAAQNQASTTEELSASVEELSSSIAEVAKSAMEANTQASAASELAEQGGKAVADSVDSTRQIARSSEQITEIIGTISEIADQTNLLALNAAIEAARAGEHGMGFAVVADEVRKLAERSSQAAREIATLIKDSGEKVREGTKMAEHAGEQLQAIVSGVEKTAGAIGQISAATEQQTATADEVAKAVQSTASVTEENAGAASGIAQSAQSLSTEADVLSTLTDLFHVGEPTVIDRAVAAHTKWKSRLFHACDGGEVPDRQTASVDNACDLGKWIYGEGQAYMQDPLFKEMVARHKDFHSGVGGIIDMIKGDKKDSARQELEHGAFSKLSGEVVGLLLRCKRLLHR